MTERRTAGGEVPTERERPSRQALLRGLAYVRRCVEERERHAAREADGSAER